MRIQVHIAMKEQKLYCLVKIDLLWVKIYSTVFILSDPRTNKYGLKDNDRQIAQKNALEEEEEEEEDDDEDLGKYDLWGDDDEDDSKDKDTTLDNKKNGDGSKAKRPTRSRSRSRSNDRKRVKRSRSRSRYCSLCQ